MGGDLPIQEPRGERTGQELQAGAGVADNPTKGAAGETWSGLGGSESHSQRVQGEEPRDRVGMALGARSQRTVNANLCLWEVPSFIGI